LIDMHSFEAKGMKWILRYVDCLSGFSQVHCLPNKSSAVVGEALVQILSTSVKPTILQSDNGSEFVGEYVSHCVRVFLSLLFYITNNDK